MKKVALIDFCETVVDFQTADAYVQFCLTRKPGLNKHLSMLYNLSKKFHVLGVMERVSPKSSIAKRLCLYQLKGLEKVEMVALAGDYYETKLKPHFIKPVIDLIGEIKQNYEVCIVSGGYDIYLEFFQKEFNIENRLSAKLKFKNGRFTGKLDGVDCMFDHKVRMLKEKYGKASNTQNWIALSDSITDMPMLRMVGRPIVVSRGKSQEWAEEQGFEQIIW